VVGDHTGILGVVFLHFLQVQVEKPKIHSNSNSPKQLFTTSIHTSRTIIQDLQILLGFNFWAIILVEEGFRLPSFDQEYI
jgi:hypothetical protein